MGTVVRVPERLLDAVTGVSGCGPAYLFLVAEALIDGGVLVGLSRDLARTLVVETMLGSARLLAETGEVPEALRAAVTSPGGTTAAGLRTLESRGVRSAFMEAVATATERSRKPGSLKAQRRRFGGAPDPGPDVGRALGQVIPTFAGAPEGVQSGCGGESDTMVQPLDSSHTRFMTVSEVAAVLRVSNMTVYRLINAGQLPAVRIGRSFRVPRRSSTGTWPSATPRRVDGTG